MSFIEGAELYLRPLTEQDATQTYVDWLNNPAVNQYLEVRHEKQSINLCKSFIDAANTDKNCHLFGIFLKESDRHIGNAKIGFINTYYSRGQLSLFIGDELSWGKGYATEVVRLLTQFGFEQLGLERIEAGCYEDNLASLRVFLKCGYSVEGFFRNHVISDGRQTGCFWLAILKSEHA